jgi:EmrB/QacA subfamily drug resistance transporter
MTAAPHRPHHNVTFAVLSASAVSYALLQSLVAPALPTIQQDLHTTPSGAAWILTAFLLSASVVTPIAGRLGDMFGKKRTLVAVLVMLAVGTVVAGLATSIDVMIAGRTIQGASGAIFPLSFAIIRDEFPRDRVPHGIALISAILGIGGGLGIVLAGPITQALSYHWLFWLPLVAILASMAGLILFVPESPIRNPGRIDWLGAGLLTAWLVALLVAVSEGSAWGWASPRVIGLLAASFVLLVVWVRLELTKESPLVDMAMMRMRPVWTTNLAAFVFGFGMYSSFVLVPQFVELPTSTGYGFAASVTAAGVFMLPATVAMLLGGPLAARLGRTVGSRVPLALGALAASIAFCLLTIAHGSGWEIYLAMFVLGIGIGLAYAAMANLIVESVSSGQTGIATGMNTIVRTIGGAIGTQITAGIVTASVASNGYPSEQGFSVAFGVGAAALLLGVFVSLAVPRSRPQAFLQPAAEAA